MIALRDLPLRRKLLLVILLTSSFALLLMGSALITYELVTFRRTLVKNMGVLAEIIGSNSTAALAFREPRDAQEVLSALAAEDQVRAAAIYDAQGNLFAQFPAGLTRANFPAEPPERDHVFEQDRLLLSEAILLEGKQLGTIYLEADLGAMFTRISVYGLLLLISAAGSAVATIILSATLQRRISHPILELARVASAVSARQDYSVRATKYGEDEIGQLTDALNQMLTAIGERDAAVTASEERLRLALEGSQTGTWDWNLVTGRITWDDYMYPLFGRTREQFDGRPETWKSFIHPDDREDLERRTRAILQKRGDIDVTFRVIDAAGEVRHMASRGRVFRDETGRPVRMSGVNMDVTKAKKAEEELNTAKEAAEAANRSKDNFLAVLSHELRTPLTPVLATVSLLENDNRVPEVVRREIDVIRRNIEVEARLIDDLLDVTGIARGKVELNRQVVDVRPLLEHALQHYCGDHAARKKLALSLRIDATETHILADSSRMTQVFWNLMQNACKFTPESGSVTVRVFNEPDAVSRPAAGPGGTPPDLVVEVADTGIGIRPEFISRIFNAFEQGEESRARTFGGLGLGLAISRALVDLHGGTLVATSEGTGKGTRMTIRLQTVRAPATAPVLPVGPAGPDPAMPPLRILLVEDHEDTAAQLRRLLQRAGHTVLSASSGAEARRLFDGEIDLVISDLGLPDGSGHELLRELTARRPVPAIALSGYGMREDINASLAAGFSRHLTKPVGWEELRTALEKVMGAPEPASA